MSKRVKAIVKRGLIMLIITIVLLEVGLRLFGFGVFELPEYSMTSSPARHLSPDEKLGVRLNPGTYQVTINKQLKYTATHLKNGQRSCGIVESEFPRETSVAFYGCSFTYGTGVNDSEVYPFLIQEKFPDLKIENRAVPGYGQAQILLNLEQELISSQKPDILILNYLSFHNERNTLNPSYRQKLRMGYQITERDDEGIAKFKCNYPYGSVENGELRLEQKSIQEINSTFPLISYSASMNALQNVTDGKSIDAAEDEKVTLEMIDRIHEVCKSNGVEFVISTMMNDDVTNRLITHCLMKSIPTIDIAVDLTQKGFTNAPYDQHPSAKAHKIFAEKLSVYLSEIE
jgi:hypothetical protein